MTHLFQVSQGFIYLLKFLFVSFDFVLKTVSNGPVMTKNCTIVLKLEYSTHSSFAELSCFFVFLCCFFYIYMPWYYIFTLLYIHYIYNFISRCVLLYFYGYTFTLLPLVYTGHSFVHLHSVSRVLKRPSTDSIFPVPITTA